MGGKAKFNTSIKESMAQQLFSSTESGISDDSLSLTVSGYIQMYIYGHFNSVVLSKMRDCTYSNHCHMCFGDYQLQKLHLVSHLNHYFYIWLCVLLKKKCKSRVEKMRREVTLLHKRICHQNTFTGFQREIWICWYWRACFGDQQWYQLNTA